MQQYDLSLEPLNAEALLVRDADGAMRPASRKEILAVARELVNADDLRGHDLSSPALVKEFLRLRLNAALEYEVFGLILLDGQNRLIEYLEPFRGTINQAAVYPREVVKLALAKNAQSVMLVHNHPSGAREASRADIALTKHLKDALALVDVRVLDHFIVAGSEVVSMAEAGLL
ncbi:JAB domain-containing protein [Alcaligenes faecalis subsp. phenolicus]|uniref:JAB domain-containing protein n=1 Tax=Alcaligenes nematophilus TaxID=2994643 RepID=UPI002AA34FCA|nr:JAB domain-containing protein [Alcaligenes phenolicus]